MWRYREQEGMLWEDRGEGPGLVLLHGGDRGPEAMKRLGEHLSLRRRVLIPHLRSRVEDSLAGAAHESDREEQRLVRFLQEEGLQRAAIVGHGSFVSRTLSLASRQELSPEAVLVLGPPVLLEHEDGASGLGAGKSKWSARIRPRLRRLAAQGCTVTIFTSCDAEQHVHHAQEIQDATRGQIVVLEGKAEALLEEGLEEVARATRSALMRS